MVLAERRPLTLHLSRKPTKQEPPRRLVAGYVVFMSAKLAASVDSPAWKRTTDTGPD